MGLDITAVSINLGVEKEPLLNRQAVNRGHVHAGIVVDRVT